MPDRAGKKARVEEVSANFGSPGGKTTGCVFQQKDKNIADAARRIVSRP
jgi:hypothetical protein